MHLANDERATSKEKLILVKFFTLFVQIFIVAVFLIEACLRVGAKMFRAQKRGGLKLTLGALCGEGLV